MSSRLILTSERLANRVKLIDAIAATPHSSLFERQNLGSTTSLLRLGTPARPDCAPANEASSVLNLSGSSYLGLGCDERVQRAAVTGLMTHGTHAAGTRLLSGTMAVHWALEGALSKLWSVPGVVVYPSGYVANLSVISCMFRRGDVVILDKNAHRSLYDGARLSGATRRRFRHNDVADLQRALRVTDSSRRRLVVVESVYSMEGDIAPIPDLIEVAREAKAFVLVDEAHAIGVLGERGTGSLEHFGLPPHAIDLRIGTLSKALSSIGGFVSAEPEVLQVLRYTSHGTVFSAATTPADAAAAAEAIRILMTEPDRVGRLRSNADVFRTALADRGLDTMGSSTPIVPVRIGDREDTLSTASRLLAEGILVSPMVSPAVAKGTERLRCVINAHHEERELVSAAATIGAIVARCSGASRNKRSSTGATIS